MLARPPAEIELQFDELVNAGRGAVRLYDSDGERLDSGAITSRNGGTVVVAPLGSVGNGGYVVTWRVVSGHSHPLRTLEVKVRPEGVRVHTGTVDIPIR